MIKVSVIVPVYNVELYIQDCLDSIINQTLKDIEIICVDDCSTDNSFSILDEYSKRDNRVKLLRHSQNKGLGPARNTGIYASNGEYIAFIDSDDFLSTDYLENLYNTAKKYDSDIVSTLNLYYYEEGVLTEKYCHINKYISKKDKNIEGKSYISINDEKNNSKEYLYVTSTNKIYRKKFILDNNLFFMDIKSGSEDVDFYIRELLNNPKTSYNHNSIYYHRIRKGSLTNKAPISLDSFKNSIKLMYNSIEYCKVKDIKFLPFVYIIAFETILTKFNQAQDKNKFYEDIHIFSKSIDLLDKNICIRYLYQEFINIRSSLSIDDYLYKNIMFEYIYKIEVNQEITNSWFRLFGINNNKDYLIIILFGIKIVIKKKK